MSAAANNFLDRLEQLGILDDEVLARARRRVAESRSVVRADDVAKMLIDGGHLTKSQAKKLLGKADEQPTSTKPTPAESPPKPAAPESEEDLGLADLDDHPGEEKTPSVAAATATKSTAPAEKPKPSSRPADKAASKPAKSTTDKKGAQPGAEDIIVLEEAPASKTPAAAPSPSSAGLAPVGTAELSPVPDSGLTPVGGMGMPLGGAAMDPFAAPMGGAGAGMQPGAAPSGAPGFKKAKPKTFDSPFLLLGGGLLVLLIIAGIILTIVLMRGNASDLFEAAESDYKSQAYNQAIAKYDKFLAQFGGDPNASKARVRRALAEIRSVVEGNKDYKLGLQRAKDVIPKIESEERFADGRQELAGILPEIADGLAKQARLAGATEKARELVTLTAEALDLVNNPSYIPTSLRTSQQNRIDDIVRVLAEAQRHIEQEDGLVKALDDIEAAISAGQTGEAFEIRKSLLRTFPALESNERLVEKVLKVAQRERELVQALPMSAEATRDDDPEVPDVRRILISHRRGESVAKPEHPVLFFLAAGAVYGLDASSGQVLWRRTVGYETRVHPMVIGKAPAEDALLVDGARNELVRIEGRTGKLVWRLRIGERFSQPALSGSRALVTTETGAVWEVDVESGKSARRVKFPQALNLEVGPLGAGSTTYQVGSHSHVYAISLDKLACQEVYYLGHRAGTIVVPPVVSLNHVFIAENAGPDYCLLHVLATNAEGFELQRPAEQEPIRLSGHVTSPLIQVKNRVIAVTNLGEIRVIDVDPTNSKKPAKVSATLIKSLSRPQPSYSLVDGAQIWIGADRFISFDIQASRQQLNRRWVRHEQEVFVAPLQRTGKTVFHARRRRGSPGVTISAANMEDGKPIWQTDLAVPLPLVATDAERKQIVAISGQGDLFRVSKEAIDSGLLDRPVETAEVEGSATTYSFNDAQTLPGGRTVLFSDLDRSAALVFDPSRAGDELVVVRVDTAGAAVTCEPTLLGGAMLLPLDNGQVWLADLATGKQRVLPFQPRVEPGLKVRWLRPAVSASEQPECILADSRQKLYRAGIKDQPNAHLGGLAEVDAPAPLLTPPAVSVDTVFGVSRSPDSDKIHLFPLPSLTESKEVPLGGRLLQGPWAVGNFVLVVSDTDGLLCFGSDPAPRWKMPLPSGPLAAPPRLDGETILLSSLKGEVWRASLEDGKVIKKIDLGAPLLGAPVPYGNRLLVGGADGTLYALPQL